MADTSKVIDLRSLQNAIAGKIELNEGVHDVRKFTGEQYQLALAITADPAENVERIVRLVSESVPTLPEMQVRKLGPEVWSAIIALASQGIDAVEKLFPNVTSPETSTPPG